MSGPERRAPRGDLGAGAAGTWARGLRARVGRLTWRLGFSRRRRTRRLRMVEAPSWEGRGSYLSQAESELPRGCYSDGNSRQVLASDAISFAGSLPGGSGSRPFVLPGVDTAWTRQRLGEAPASTRCSRRAL